MALEKKSITALWIFFSFLVIVMGIVSFGLDYTSWLAPTTSLFGGAILLLEVGIKRLTPLSSLRKLGSMQYITLVIGFLSIINGFLTLPAIDIKVLFLNQISGFVLIMVGIFIALEGLTQRS